MLSLNDMIRQAIGDAEEAEQSAPTTPEVQAAPPASSGASIDHGELSKLASALEFVGTRGVESLLVLEKDASAAAPPAGTNAGQTHGEKKQSQVQPHKGAPPMKPKATGAPDDNEHQRPGGNAPSPDTSSTQKGASHPGLKSNEAAIGVTKADKAKLVAPALSKLLSATPFSDPKVKENLRNAGKAGERNINAGKAKTASGEAAPQLPPGVNLEQVREELARRVNDGGQA